MQPEHLEALAAEVALSIKSALAPVLERLALAEARLATVADLAQKDTTVLSALRERVAVVETRPIPVGEKGEKGDPGTNGVDGKPGLAYVGVYQDGKTYEKGDVVTWAGSMWHAQTPTLAKPGDGSKDWQLCVKHGRDGRDAK